MKAAVFHKIGDISVDNVDDPKIEKPDDIVLKVTTTAICGSDLHIYDGFVPQLRDMVLGHEFMGIVEEVGPEVTRVKKGDRVVVPFTIACGQCFFCQQGFHPSCEHTNPEHYGPEGDLLKGKGGGMFGYTDLYGGYNGGQAEYVRVPHANVGPKIIPDGLSDEQVVFLTDIFPTGWSAVKWGKVKPGDTVVIFGSGPVGLMAQKAAWLNGAERVIAVDPLEYRLEKARTVNKVDTLNAGEDDLREKIYAMTNGRGADVAIDAVGMEANRSVGEKLKAVFNAEKGTSKVIEMCTEAVRRNGIVSVVGVYASPYDNFPIHRIFDKGLIMQFGQAQTHVYIDECFEMVRSGKVVLDDIITHRLPLSQASEAYDMFKHKTDDCVKVVLKPELDRK
ncbi:zinc-dependent alcohol dehydrogenase [Flavisolibacter ginsenosidimutans]|uniref:Glutathione-dependent formaldehyde dehydrogenase n=1 Tax=Flavisolibacter ginsenosidimutans TaxID=661481 RepID=A0A5B8UIE5_9BACT|nr:zinc-dependent alcohol dehydrogenase [Flavisolibacter ginsenosidimutans]QEC56444.1 glutathione-dependent formaldehyde dehydrogenase [Flavisolibacter ginsenosidimutans]